MKQKKYFLFLIAIITLMSVNIALPSVSHTVLADYTTQIKLPHGYTQALVKRADDGDKKAIKRLAPISANGMKSNQFEDDDESDSRVVEPAHLSKADQKAMSLYALKVINSARKQMHKPNWYYTRRCNRFADSVAHYYYLDGASAWDEDHDVKAILKAAKQHGINNKLGQVYEDLAALPISTEFHGQTRTIKALKSAIYFNIKQMIFGGFYGRDSDFDNLSHYWEYGHARALLSVGYDASLQKCEAAVSFSGLKNDSEKLSLHILNVPKAYIVNRRLFK